MRLFRRQRRRYTYAVRTLERSARQVERDLIEVTTRGTLQGIALPEGERASRAALLRSRFQDLTEALGVLR